MAKPVASFNF